MPRGQDLGVPHVQSRDLGVTRAPGQDLDWRAGRALRMARGGIWTSEEGGGGLERGLGGEGRGRDRTREMKQEAQPGPPWWS